MTRRTQAEGLNLTAALRVGIADVVGCELEKVELNLQAPGIDELTGSFRFDLEVAPQSLADDVVVAETAAPARTPGVHDEAAAAETAAPTRTRGDGDEGRAAPEEVTPAELEEEAEAAADFLEGLLDALDLPGDLRIRVKEQHAEVEIADVGSGALIGRRGQTLEAMQELVRCAMQRQFERRSRVQIDVEGYRARRIEKLLEKAEEAIDATLDTGEPQRLEPMDVFERKAVHHLVADVDGLVSRSQGREPGRRIVIEPEE